MWYGSLQCLQVPIDWQNHGVTNIFSFVFLSTNPTYLKPEKCAPKLRLQCCDWGRSVLFKCKNCAADSAAIEVGLCFLNAVDSAATEVDLCFLNPEWTPSSGGSGCAAGGRLPLTLRWIYIESEIQKINWFYWAYHYQILGRHENHQNPAKSCKKNRTFFKST